MTVLMQCSALRSASLVKALNRSTPHTRKVGLHFLRIQKTATTTFGDVVMRAFCGSPADDCKGSLHTDWSQASENGTYTGPIVTLLRHPVDRTLSEFYWLRTTDGRIGASLPFWDFRNSTWLSYVQNEPNTSKAFDAYLHHYRRNPSRNRQVLYLLGFREGREGKNGFILAKNPGATYDWDDHPGGLARQAMERLESLTAFGIVECWNSSMRAISRALGWNASAVQALASSTHERQFSKEGLIGHLRRDALLSTTGEDVSSSSKWSKVVPKKVVEAITRWNNADMTLYKAAKKRFSEKFGEECA